jgi:SAM-dependent methyltransferase
MISCKACEIVYLWPQPTPEALESHYQQASILHGTSTEVQYLSRVYSQNNKETAESLLLAIEKYYGKSKANLVGGYVADIGCNAADFLFGFKELGFEKLLGVEPDQKLQTWNQHYVGCDTHIGMLSTVEDRYRGTCSILALRDSLEHHLDPLSSMLKCFQLLAPGGVLYLQVPNIKCKIAVHNLEAFEWFEPDHLYYFSSKSISELLTKAGFNKIVTETPATDFDRNDHALISAEPYFSEAMRASIEAEKAGRILRCFAIKI